MVGVWVSLDLRRFLSHPHQVQHYRYSSFIEMEPIKNVRALSQKTNPKQNKQQNNIALGSEQEEEGAPDRRVADTRNGRKGFLNHRGQSLAPRNDGRRKVRVGPGKACKVCNTPLSMCMEPKCFTFVKGSVPLHRTVRADVDEERWAFQLGVSENGRSG